MGVPTALADALARLTPSVSAARARQLRWVAGEMAEAAEQLRPELRPRSTSAWFSPSFVSSYLDLADSGALRRRDGHGRAGSSASARVRRVCLRMLAGEHEPGLPDLAMPTVDPPRDRAPHGAVDAAMSRLVRRAADPLARPGVVRAAALTCVVADTGMRVGELAAVAVSDLDLQAGTVRWTPKPQARRSAELLPERTTKLSSRTQAALRRWMEVRAGLTELTPRSRALFVSVSGNHDGSGVRRPAGLPLRERGMQRAHDRAVAALNAELAGTDGYPLPRVLGALRQADDEGLPHGEAHKSGGRAS